ncbi:hypothetical protein IE81DRAFT_150117 [Ceraceosorus guamensis]|uniref:Uncharacterized protein n=1 Tax=Ceraceosorus guamensis TaxID=1522189 RepID=A0A316VZV9_9BASI|nr:hypothetical protein IE81DRAFT_150117 [Ceraceosorus guamensis]PWN41983.1 hypothetical protein IE81DRAFT_150117 [Ceraceosorus guamensis]
MLFLARKHILINAVLVQIALGRVSSERESVMRRSPGLQSVANAFDVSHPFVKSLHSELGPVHRTTTERFAALQLPTFKKQASSQRNAFASNTPSRHGQLTTKLNETRKEYEKVVLGKGTSSLANMGGANLIRNPSPEAHMTDSRSTSPVSVLKQKHILHRVKASLASSNGKGDGGHQSGTGVFVPKVEVYEKSVNNYDGLKAYFGKSGDLANMGTRKKINKVAEKLKANSPGVFERHITDGASSSGGRSRASSSRSPSPTTRAMATGDSASNAGSSVPRITTYRRREWRAATKLPV